MWSKICYLFTTSSFKFLFIAFQATASKKLRRFCIFSQKLQHGKVGGEGHRAGNITWDCPMEHSNHLPKITPKSLFSSSLWKVLSAVRASPAAIPAQLPTSPTSQPARAPALCHAIMPSFSTWKLFQTCYLFCVKFPKHQASCTCLRKWQSWDAQPTLTPTPIIPMSVHARDWEQQKQCGEREQLHYMVSRQGCYPWTQTRQKLNLLTPKVLKTLWN